MNFVLSNHFQSSVRQKSDNRNSGGLQCSASISNWIHRLHTDEMACIIRCHGLHHHIHTDDMQLSGGCRPDDDMSGHVSSYACRLSIAQDVVSWCGLAPVATQRRKINDTLVRLTCLPPANVRPRPITYHRHRHRSASWNSVRSRGATGFGADPKAAYHAGRRRQFPSTSTPASDMSTCVGQDEAVCIVLALITSWTSTTQFTLSYQTARTLQFGWFPARSSE